MKKLLALLLVTAGALLIVGGVVIGLDDTSTLVPAPSAVLEGFLRNIMSGRAGQSVPYVAEELRREMGDKRLEVLFDSSRAHIGDVLDVRGEGEEIRGDAAQATASIRSLDRGVISITLPMKRTSGVWKVAGVEDLLRKASGRASGR